MRTAPVGVLCGTALALAVCGASCCGTRDTAPPAPPSRPGISLRPRFEALGLTPKDQAPRGCCSLFALCGVLEFEFAQAAAAAPLRFSEEYLNWASHQTNGRRTDGSFFADALAGIATFGLCRENLMPYERHFRRDAEPPEAAHEDARTRREVSARWIKSWDVRTGMTDAMLADIRRELSAGHPVAIGMRWPRHPTYSPDGLLTVPAPEDVFDGHSVVIVGWQEDPAVPGGGVFEFRNSFGPAWRDGGYGRMPYAYVQAYGNDAVTLRAQGGTPRPGNREARQPLEFEALPVVETHGCSAGPQAMDDWGAARWSGGAQLFCRTTADGANLTIDLPPVDAGLYQLTLYASRAPDYGIVRVQINGNGVGSDLDLYAERVEPTGPVPLGTVALGPEPPRLRVEVGGRHPRARGSCFGLDCLELTPLP